MTPEQVLLLVVFGPLAIGCGVSYLAYRYWYVPLRHRRKVERLRREQAEGIPPSPKDYHHAISFDSEGFTVTNLHNSKYCRINWKEVDRVVVFKRDFFTYDCICMFLSLADGSGIELDEEMAGWSRFMTEMPLRLPGCKPSEELYKVVVYPAFVTNETEIYSRLLADAESTKPTTFNELEILDGIVYRESDFHSSLTEWYHRVRDLPFSSFSIEDFCRSVIQNLYPEYVVPLAIEALEKEPLAGELYDGELAGSFSSISDEFWRENEGLALRLLHALKDILHQIDEAFKANVLRTVARLEAVTNKS